MGSQSSRGGEVLRGQDGRRSCKSGATPAATRTSLPSAGPRVAPQNPLATHARYTCTTAPPVETTAREMYAGVVAPSMRDQTSTNAAGRGVDGGRGKGDEKATTTTVVVLPTKTTPAAAATMATTLPHDNGAAADTRAGEAAEESRDAHVTAVSLATSAAAAGGGGMGVVDKPMPSGSMGTSAAAAPSNTSLATERGERARVCVAHARRLFQRLFAPPRGELECMASNFLQREQMRQLGSFLAVFLRGEYCDKWCIDAVTLAVLGKERGCLLRHGITPTSTHTNTVGSSNNNNNNDDDDGKSTALYTSVIVPSRERARYLEQQRGEYAMQLQERLLVLCGAVHERRSRIQHNTSLRSLLRNYRNISAANATAAPAMAGKLKKLQGDAAATAAATANSHDNGDDDVVEDDDKKNGTDGDKDEDGNSGHDKEVKEHINSNHISNDDDDNDDNGDDGNDDDRHHHSDKERTSVQQDKRATRRGGTHTHELDVVLATLVRDRAVCTHNNTTTTTTTASASANNNSNSNSSRCQHARGTSTHRGHHVSSQSGNGHASAGGVGAAATSASSKSAAVQLHLTRLRSAATASFQCLTLLSNAVSATVLSSLPADYFLRSVPIADARVAFVERKVGELTGRSFFVTLAQRVELLSGARNEEGSAVRAGDPHVWLNGASATTATTTTTATATAATAAKATTLPTAASVANRAMHSMTPSITSPAELLAALRNLTLVLSTACSSLVSFVLFHLAEMLYVRRCMRALGKDAAAIVTASLARNSNSDDNKNTNNNNNNNNSSSSNGGSTLRTPPTTTAEALSTRVNAREAQVQQWRQDVALDEMSLVVVTRLLIQRYRDEHAVKLEKLRKTHYNFFAYLAALTPPDERAEVEVLPLLSGMALKLMFLIAGGTRSIAADDRRVPMWTSHPHDDVALGHALQVPVLNSICGVACMLGMPVVMAGKHAAMGRGARRRSRTLGFAEADECAGVMRELFQAVGALPCASHCPRRFVEWLPLFPLYAVDATSKRILLYLYALHASAIRPLSLTMHKDLILPSAAASLRRCSGFDRANTVNYLFEPHLTVGGYHDAIEQQPQPQQQQHSSGSISHDYRGKEDDKTTTAAAADASTSRGATDTPSSAATPATLASSRATADAQTTRRGGEVVSCRARRAHDARPRASHALQQAQRTTRQHEHAQPQAPATAADGVAAAAASSSSLSTASVSAASSTSSMTSSSSSSSSRSASTHSSLSSSSLTSELLDDDMDIDAYTCVSLQEQLYMRCANEATVRRHRATELTPSVTTRLFTTTRALLKSDPDMARRLTASLPAALLPHERLLLLRWRTSEPCVTMRVGDFLPVLLEWSTTTTTTTATTATTTAAATATAAAAAASMATMVSGDALTRTFGAAVASSRARRQTRTSVVVDAAREEATTAPPPPPPPPSSLPPPLPTSLLVSSSLPSLQPSSTQASATVMASTPGRRQRQRMGTRLTIVQLIPCKASTRPVGLLAAASAEIATASASMRTGGRGVVGGGGGGSTEEATSSGTYSAGSSSNNCNSHRNVTGGSSGGGGGSTEGNSVSFRSSNALFDGGRREVRVCEVVLRVCSVDLAARQHYDVVNIGHERATMSVFSFLAPREHVCWANPQLLSTLLGLRTSHSVALAPLTSRRSTGSSSSGLMGSVTASDKRRHGSNNTQQVTTTTTTTTTTATHGNSSSANNNNNGVGGGGGGSSSSHSTVATTTLCSTPNDVHDIFHVIGLLLANTIVNGVFLRIPFPPLLFALLRRALLTGDHAFRNFMWLEPCDGSLLSPVAMLNAAYGILTMTDYEYYLFLKTRGLHKARNRVFPVLYSAADESSHSSSSTTAAGSGGGSGSHDSVGGNNYNSSSFLCNATTTSLGECGTVSDAVVNATPKTLAAATALAPSMASTMDSNAGPDVAVYVSALHKHNNAGGLFSRCSGDAYGGAKSVNDVGNGSLLGSFGRDNATASACDTSQLDHAGNERGYDEDDDDDDDDDDYDNDADNDGVDDDNARLLSGDADVPSAHASALRRALLSQLPSRQEYIALYLVNELAWSSVQCGGHSGHTKDLWVSLVKGVLTSPLAKSPLFACCCSRIIAEVFCTTTR